MLTRRSFIKGAGASAAVAVVTARVSDAVAQDNAQASKVVGPGAVGLTLKINGKDQKLQIEPRTTLAEALRSHLDLTGTKVVCDRGACSACTVWIDGTPMLSCMTLAIDCSGKEIRTIEGLSVGDTLHPVQEEFINHDALQCGFCTPGMIMSCAALLEKNKNPTLDDVKQATSGNLCRCGTYPKVFDATLAAAKR